MSIKTLPDRGAEHILAFFVISLAIHMVLVWALTFWGPAYGMLFEKLRPKPREPVVVDVVTLPPGPKEKVEPQRQVKRFAQRSQQVEKETFPEARGPSGGIAPGPGIAKRPLAAPEEILIKEPVGAKTEVRKPAVVRPVPRVEPLQEQAVSKAPRKKSVLPEPIKEKPEEPVTAVKKHDLKEPLKEKTVTSKKGVIKKEKGPEAEEAVKIKEAPQEKPRSPLLVIENPVVVDEELKPWEEALLLEEEKEGVKKEIPEKRPEPEALLTRPAEPSEAAKSTQKVITPEAPEHLSVEEEPEPAPQPVKPSPEEETPKRSLPGLGDLFPTDERVAQLAEEYEKAPPKKERGKKLQLNTSELRYYKYLRDMKRKIELKWEFPFVAIRNGWQGNLRIDFTIGKDGKIKDIKLIKSSNYPVLDDAAITAIRLAAPFPNFPDNFEIEEINIRASFEYKIYGPVPDDRGYRSR